MLDRKFIPVVAMTMFALPNIVLPSMVCAADWPQFLGLARNGTSTETGLLEQLPDGGPQVVWRAPGGVGMSSVVIADGVAITSWNQNEQQWLVALDALSGRKIWETSLGNAYQNQMGDGPRATPTVHAEIVAALTGEGLLCVVERKSGKLKWQVDTTAMFGGQPSEYGMSSSPLITNGLVVTHVGATDAAIVAFDLIDGKPVWQAGSSPAGYSSPTLLSISGEQQIVSFTGNELVGLTPNTGTLLWKYPFKTDYACNTATPIEINGDVFISAGENHGCALLTIERKDNMYAVTERWSSLNNKSVMRNEWQTSVALDGYIYGFDNVGAAGPVTHLSCIDATNGKPIWQKSRFGKGNVVLADGKLWITTVMGELVLVNATPTGYEELGRASMFDMTRQTLSIANGLGYIRDDQEVLCLQLK